MFCTVPAGLAKNNQLQGQVKNHLQTAGPGPSHVLTWCSVALGCGYQLFGTTCPTCTTERQLSLSCQRDLSKPGTPVVSGRNHSK